MKRSSFAATPYAVAALLLCAMLGLNPARGAESAQTLIGRYMEALGGVDHYRKLLDRHVDYEAQSRNRNPDLNSSFKWAVSHRGAKQLRVLRRIGNEFEEFGTDGTDFWHRASRSTPAGDAKEARGEMELDLMLEGFLLEYETHGFAATVSDSAPHRVVFQRGEASQPKPGDRVEFLFDDETGLIKEMSLLRSAALPGKVTLYTLRYSSYEPVAGVPFARKLEVVRGEKIIIEATVKSVEIGKQFTKGYFARPSRG